MGGGGGVQKDREVLQQSSCTLLRIAYCQLTNPGPYITSVTYYIFILGGNRGIPRHTPAVVFLFTLTLNNSFERQRGSELCSDAIFKGSYTVKCPAVYRTINYSTSVYPLHSMAHSNTTTEPLQKQAVVLTETGETTVQEEGN